jgi:aminoglycoside phosphotransferase (APT) family kinase protein
MADFERFQDAGRMRALLSEHLRWGDGSAVIVQSCAVDYARQSSGRLMLHYDTTVHHPTTGRDQREMVTAIVADERRAALLLSEGMAALRTTEPDQLVAAVAVPEENLLLQVFPFDSRLPGLAPLMTDPASLLAPHVPAAANREVSSPAAWTSEIVRYRVGMRAMVRVTIADDDEARSPRRIYAKVFRDEATGVRTYEIQRAIWEATTAGGAAFAVARPLGWLPDARVLVLDEAAGVSLRAILASEEPAEAAVRQAARAIAAFHQLPTERLAANPRRRPTRDEAARPDKLAERLHASAPQLASEIDTLVAKIAARLSEAPRAPTHFDLRPGHLLIDGDRVALIDFDKIALADPLVDVANFLTLLEEDWKSSVSSPGQQERLPQVFREEYFALVPPQWAARLPAHYALALLAQAAQRAEGSKRRAGKASQAQRVYELVRRAHDALAESAG